MLSLFFAAKLESAMRILKYAVITLLLFLVLLVIVLASGCVIWRSPAYYTEYPAIPLKKSIMTPEEYGAVVEAHARPYIVRHEAGTSAVLLFGAEHTRDPKHPQLDQLRNEWKKFRPTVALVEGRLGFLFRWFMDPVVHLGEGGLVYDLAKSDGIDTYSWDPPLEKEVAWVQQEFPPYRVALFYVLRPYFGAFRQGPVDDPESFVEEYRVQRTAYAGLENTLPSIAAIDSIWRKEFAGLKDWRETTDEYGWPGYLNDIAKRSNSFRDEHFARVILDLVKKGHRVFAVAGSSHAVKLDSTLALSINEGQ